ncbi:helix-turn-helix transcriptional regulator [Paenibacillus sp. MZ04-78.2]|uniref:helix-turn-helix domain-containing protein n=1 Tax=Paenibacillus sp. MZ04-78.2 TaxID=2962034 RepID=UPI0020B87CE7|nr:helix-turn-helix transcriptional regulator [Paenibacillus sp. MZ04-78.2]MCP3772778.1 helix-turn-helix transcriptional regulator [Paenibacillus sp. MZ04-78.2]
MVDIKHRNNTIADFIFQLRKKKNLTYAKLEELTGVRSAVLHKIESGATKHPEYKTVRALVRALPVHYEQIIKAYIEEEEGTETLFEILRDTVATGENDSLISMTALRLLQSSQKKTEESLQRLFDFTETLNEGKLKALLYTVIIKYSRERGLPSFVGKGTFKKYLINRSNLSLLDETFREGEEVIHYTDFLAQEEKCIYYYRMALHAYALKKYEKCIELGKSGHAVDTTHNGLKEQVALAICNSFWHQRNYNALEEHIQLYDKLNYQIIVDRLKIFRAMILARTDRYVESLPLLWECLDEAQGDKRLPRLNLLLEVLLQMNDDDSIEKLINSDEEQIFPFENATPYQYSEMGKYYKFKGAFFTKKGWTNQAIETYLKSVNYYGKIGSYQDIVELSYDIFSSLSSDKNILDLGLLEETKKVYNGIINKGEV